MLAQRLGVFVTIDEVPEVWAGVASVFRDYGYRRLRHRARIKFLVADWGAEKFRQVLEDEYLKRALPDGPAPENPAGRRDHVGVHPQKDGRFYVGFAPTVGRVSGGTLNRIADLVEAAGSDRVRTTVEQKMLVLDVAEPTRSTRSSRGSTSSACTSSRASSAAARWRAPASSSASSRSSRPRLAPHPWWPSSRTGCRPSTTPLTIHVNGCPNSCARIQTADIGLKGQLVTTADGEQVDGFQVHLGGSLNLNYAASAARCAASRPRRPSCPTTSRASCVDTKRPGPARTRRSRSGSQRADEAELHERRPDGTCSTARTAATTDLRPYESDEHGLGVPLVRARLLA